MSGFPTLFFFPGKDKKSPIPYQGAREVDDIASFIMEKVPRLVSVDFAECGSLDIVFHVEKEECYTQFPKAHDCLILILMFHGAAVSSAT